MQPSMTNRRWKTVRTLALICCCTAVVVALSAWPLNRLPSSTFSPQSAVVPLQPETIVSKLNQPAGMGPTIAIIGGGLASLSAAFEASQALQRDLPQAKIVILEKNAVLGGNSAKASSGINAVNAAAGDSVQAYAADTTKSGGGFSTKELVETLAARSETGLQFLEGIGLNLSTIVRLGGHSFPRTHSNPVGPNVGFAIIKAVSSKVQEAPNVEVHTNAKVLRVETAGDGRFAIMYAGVPPAAAAAGSGPVLPEDPPLPAMLLADALILASGGFAANKQLLQKYSPAAADLPTTNGPWATGDGLELGAHLGGALIGMEHVQVHPTGFIDPNDPTAGTKWLAPEKLRGCGAILLDAGGRRFVDELTTRDKVTDAIMKLEPKQAWLLLGAAGASMFGESTLGFYASKSMIKKLDNLSAAAGHIGVSADVLLQQVEQYNAAAAAGRDAFGKQYFPTTIDLAGAVWVAQITPVVHYCMGGLRINDKAQVLNSEGAVVRGLYAAGEVSGGLHGANRLGGNSLAECVVFGRIAGQQAAQQVLPTAVVLPGRVLMEHQQLVHAV